MAYPLRTAPPRGSARLRFMFCRGLLAAGALALGGCGGGSSSSEPVAPPAPPSATTPLAWDAAQATWDSVVWQ